MKEEKAKKKKKFKALRIFGKILLGLFVFIILLLLFVRSPWGQDIIIGKVISSVSNKTNTNIALERAFITFSGNISIEGLYVEDLSGDTLVYSRSLEADIPLWPIVTGGGIAVNSIDWNGVTAKISRQDSINGFNYQFLIDAYAPADTTATVPADTTSTTNISLGELHFSNFDIEYQDEVTGMNADLKMGEFNLEMEELDLEEMRFHINDANLSNTNITYAQTKALPESEEDTTTTGSTTRPMLIVDNLRLNNINANYESIPDGMLAKVNLGEILLQMPEAKLAENIIEISQLSLNNSNIYLETTATDSIGNIEDEEGNTEVASEGPQDFEWPEWEVDINEISLAQNNITYLVNGQEPQKGTFNPNAVAVEDFNLQLNDLYLRDQSAGASLENLSFTEASGINFKQLAFNAKLDNNNFSINNLLLHINENQLNGEMALQYASVNDLMEIPENSEINVHIPQLQLAVEDAFLFQPDLRNNEYMQALSSNNITGNLDINGTLSNLQIPRLTINWGSNTSITARGNVQNPMETENIQFDFPQLDFVSNKTDLSKFVQEDSLGIAIPEQIRLTSNFQGNPENINATAALTIPEGQIDVTGSFKSQDVIAFDANLEVQQLDLGKLLQNDQLGEITLYVNTQGEGSNINNLDAVLDSEITSFSYNGYQFENLKLTGELEDGSGPITMVYKDYNLDMNMETLVDLDSVSPQFDVQLNLNGADLQALGISSRDIRTKFALDALYEGNPEGFDITSTITNGIAVYDNESYLLGEVELIAHVMQDTTSVDITNKMLDLQLRSNTSPAAFGVALQEHFSSYISEEVEIQDSIAKPVQLQLDANINQAPILNDVLVTNLEQLDTVNISVDFNQSAKKLDAMVSLPFINYNGNEIDSLEILVNSDRDNFEGSLSFNAINAGPIAINRTNLAGNIANDRLYIDFESYAQDSLLVNVQSELNAENDSLYFHINPSELLLNGNEWSIPQNNQMILAEDFIVFENFELDRNNQEVFVVSRDPQNNKENITLNFENFELASLLGFLNPENELASGQLSGDLVIEEPFSETGIIANLGIQDLTAMALPLGNLALNAEATGGNRYDFDLGLSGGDIDLDLVGNYVADTAAARLDLNLDLNELKMAALEKFTEGEINNASGSISGNIEVHGTTADPVYEGDFYFNNAEFTVAMLDAGFAISDEAITVDNEGIYFDTFNIEDENSSGFVVDGEILTENLTNPEFDLTFQAENFQALNSTEEDNELYYGTAVFDLEAHLTGDLNLPVVDLTLDILPETNLTYIIPESEVGVISREGVVVFVNKENPDNILTRNEDEETTTVSGIVVNSVINLGEGSVFNVIINEQTGDNLQVSGEGTLNFNISENGRINLAGRYELTDGHYEINLYGLVNRRFDIAPESSISWFGDPLDAALDITAIYNVETSASALMASQTSGADASTQGRFRQELPFLVYLYIDGRLMQPELSFGLGMPEDERGAIGGQIYGRVQQINSQENELNKQVFSLLVLNRFYPQSNSYGSEGGTLSFARDNLNQALSDQLNMFSDQLLGDSGVNLNFGLDSYTDYQGESPQERTALEISAEKSFFDDRLIVEVGSEVDIQGSDPNQMGNNPLIGNVSLQYLLTENGRFRLKGFRKNTFENVIDGQVIISGIALIFQREFNEFVELWAKEPEQEEQQETQEAEN